MKLKIFIILLLVQTAFAETPNASKAKVSAETSQVPAANKAKVSAQLSETPDISKNKTNLEISNEQYLKQEIKKDKEMIAKVKNNIAQKAARSSVNEQEFTENQQIEVVLSNRDINRVLVKGDKIQSVNGPTGLYMAKNDIAGSAYISAYGESTFTVFISTVNGHNFSLLVSPKAVAGKTIILQPTTLLSPQFEEAASYQKLLITLTSAMINSGRSS